MDSSLLPLPDYPFNGSLDSRVCATAAENTVHGIYYFFIRRIRIFCKQGNGLHDLAWLTVTALRGLLQSPRLLDRVILGNSFDGGNLQVLHISYSKLTRPLGLAIHMDGTGTTHVCAATVLCTCELQILPEHPQYWNLRG